VKTKGCVVCALVDARALVETELANGERVIVCANHELLHRRSGAKATDVHALRALVGERRSRIARREHLPCDELGAMLIAGFAGERRAGGDRRR
jgi:hypothetical protein